MNMTLSQTFWRSNSALRHAALVVAGIAMLIVAAKIKVMLPNTPVPITFGTFAVLTIGAAYGPRLGLATILGYMLIGALGFDIFANSTASINGWTYMSGALGGYLVGFVAATLILGFAATRGWDRSVLTLVPVLLVANVAIYAFGMAWLGYLYGFDLATAFEKGALPFLMGDAVKLGLAALALPSVWALVNKFKG